MENQNELLVKEFLKSHMGLSEKRVLQEYRGLKKYPDIEAEFVSYIKNGWDDIQSNNLVVEGFSAKQLYEQYPLSVLGAYNYLIYLREEPVEALNFLKKGLPRK